MEYCDRKKAETRRKKDNNFLYCCIHAQRVHSVYSNLLVAIEVGVFCLFLDKSNDRYYLIICSNTNDITQMSLKDHIIQLEGEKALYLTPYIHIIEIPKKYADNTFYYNGNTIDPLNFTTILYPER